MYSITIDQPRPHVSQQIPYELPELTFVGDASDVILGMPGGGYDGDVGMTEPPFEFEEDQD
jgi:hypothetical protein